MTSILNTADNDFVTIKDLPSDRFFIKINDKLNQFLIEKLIKKHSSMRKAVNKLNIPYPSFYRWKNRKQYPLFRLLFILNDVSCNPSLLLEKNVLELKSGLSSKFYGGVSKSIYPKFPIKVSKELVRIISHIFGDGCLSISKKGYFNMAYYNRSKILREEFKKDIIKLFGEIKFLEGINKTTPFVIVPSPIALIFSTKIKDFSSKSSRIPKFIKESDKLIKKEFIRVFFDDESHVRYKPPYRYIEIALSNKSFLQDLKNMINEFDINTTKIYYKKLRGFDTYYFYIRNYHNLLKYNQEIGFLHSKKKENLNNILKNPGRKSYASGETKKKILNLLKKRKRTSGELALILNRRRCTINYWLSKLRKKKRIKKDGFNKKDIRRRELIWKIRNSF